MGGTERSRRACTLRCSLGGCDESGLRSEDRHCDACARCLNSPLRDQFIEEFLLGRMRIEKGGQDSVC